MKSLTKFIKQTLVVARDVHVQLSLPVAGVLRDVQSVFFGLCVSRQSGVGRDDSLYKTLRTNPIEDLNRLIAHYTRDVKRWRDGHKVLR